jgi:hypothetical protein
MGEIVSGGTRVYVLGKGLTSTENHKTGKKNENEYFFKISQTIISLKIFWSDLKTTATILELKLAISVPWGGVWFIGKK